MGRAHALARTQIISKVFPETMSCLPIWILSFDLNRFTKEIRIISCLQEFLAILTLLREIGIILILQKFKV